MATGTSDAPPGTQEPQGKGRKAVGSQRRSWRHLLGILGPGLVTGAADDDPSGIATYSPDRRPVRLRAAVDRVVDAAGGGVTTINAAADAARALEPLVKTFPHSGEIAQGLFALGIVSLGMLAIPVLAGSTSYALSEARGKKEGLDLKPKQGRYFYGVITGSMLIGLCLNFIGVNPIRFLVFAAVFNGVAAVPLIWIINRIAADRGTMGEARSGRLSRTVLALTFIGMAASVLAMIVSYLKG